jgi:hypothetical protein
MEIDAELEYLLDDIAASIVERAKRNIKVKRTREGVRNGSTYQFTAVTNTTGKLHDSLRYRIVNRGGVPEMKFYSKGAQQYADVIEKGRRPNKGFPPPPKLIQWITKKGLKPRDADGRFIRVKDMDKWRKGLAFVIGRKIAKHGFKGINYWEEAIDAELEVRGKDIAAKIEKYIVIKINEGWL